MDKSEASIRDDLAGQLPILEGGLSLIEKEFKLENYRGSKGFIDLLATDTFGNYVIIELKRSRATSRQTLQEILKYVGLIKQNFKARDSEIRVIIVSTDWEELLVPFSEFVSQSGLRVDGFALEINKRDDSYLARPVKPVELSATRRRFSRTYEMALFHDAAKRDAYIPIFAETCQKFGLSDFVISSLDLDRKDAPSIYGYAACFSFNSFSRSQLLAFPSLAKRMKAEKPDYESEDELIDYLEQCLLIAVDCRTQRDKMELGNPEKFQSVVTVQGWKITRLSKFGIFKADPRLTDGMLIAELKGLDGTSRNQYANFADSAHRDRMEEISMHWSGPFQANKKWQKTLDGLLANIRSDKRRFRLALNIYSPDSAFYGVCRFISSADKSYLPMYVLFVDYYEECSLTIFEGNLMWDGSALDQEGFISFLQSGERVFFSKMIGLAYGYFDKDFLQHLRLDLTHKRIDIDRNGKASEQFITIGDKGKPARKKGTFFDMEHWLGKNLALSRDLARRFEQSEVWQG